MTDDLRIGDTEREAAITALGEHLSAGRLTLDEYGTRSAEATGATTRGDLMALFKDLPAPHPELDPTPSVDLAKRPDQPVVRADRSDVAKRVVTGISAASWMLWIPLLVISHGQLWWLMFVPIALSVFVGKIWYPDQDDDRREQRRARRRRHGW